MSLPLAWSLLCIGRVVLNFDSPGYEAKPRNDGRVAVLTECHRWLMRGLQWADGEAIFPLTATAPTDTTYHATGEGLPPCPLGHHASHSP